MFPRIADPMAALAQAPPPEVATLALILLLGILVGYVVFVIAVARWIHRDAKRRGHDATLWTILFVVLSLLGIVAGLILVVIYLATRSAAIKYDDQGHMVVPPNPTMTPQAPMTPPTPVPTPPGQAPPPPVASPIGGLGPPSGPMARVKCPRCHTIFPYQKALQGPTHVKCPACGEEGNI